MKGSYDVVPLSMAVGEVGCNERTSALTFSCIGNESTKVFCMGRMRSDGSCSTAIAFGCALIHRYGLSL